jgi:predicted nuclease of predicted toxin-antitoxin system
VCSSDLAVESSRGATDEELLARAFSEQRFLVTEDKDFGWLVFASHAVSVGVILIRYPNNLRSTLGQSVVQLVEQYGSELVNAFVVVQPGQVRFSRKE